MKRGIYICLNAERHLLQVVWYQNFSFGQTNNTQFIGQGERFNGECLVLVSFVVNGDVRAYRFILVDIDLIGSCKFQVRILSSAVHRYARNNGQGQVGEEDDEKKRPPHDSCSLLSPINDSL